MAFQNRHTISDKLNESWLRRTIALVVVSMAPALLACSSTKDSAQADSFTEGAFDPTYAIYGSALRQFVRGDCVDYKGLSEKKNELQKVVAGFSALSSDSLQKLSREDQMALYINAYNAITLYSILEHYPDIKSIKDINGVWDKRKWNVAGEQLTLNDIENKKLRAQFNDPRIHFAINCASLGCPPLSSEPFVGATLEKQLAERAHSFFNDPERFTYDSSSGALHVSKIFKWFGKDFLANKNPRPKNGKLSERDAAVVAFIAARLPQKTAQQILDGAKSLEYMEYSWTLNDIEHEK